MLDENAVIGTPAQEEPGAVDQGTCEHCGISLGDWTEDGICGDCADDDYNWGGVNAEIAR